MTGSVATGDHLWRGGVLLSAKSTDVRSGDTVLEGDRFWFSMSAPAGQDFRLTELVVEESGRTP